MKKTIYIIVILFLFSCKTNKTLRGTWIGDYNSFKFGSLNFIVYEPNLLTFKKNKCFSKSSKEQNGGYGTKIKESNSLFSNNIIFENPNSEASIYEFVKITNDSLALTLKSKTGDALKVYRKLKNTLKHNQKIDLVGKKFIFKGVLDRDIIHFKTDSTYSLTRTTSLLKDVIPLEDIFPQKWERINYEGFDLIFIFGGFSILIENKNEKIINLRTFSKSEIKFTMTELE